MAMPDFSQLQQQWKDRQAKIDGDITSLNGQIEASGSKYVRNPMNPNQLMLINTGVDPKAGVDYAKSLVDLQTSELGLQEKTTQASTGLTAAELSKLKQGSSAAEQIYNRISSLSKDVNKTNLGPISRLSGLSRSIAGWAGFDPQARALESQKGQLVVLLKSLTGVGRLSAGVIDQIQSSYLPTPYDTKAEAEDKLANLKGVIDQMKQDSGQTQNSDPLGILGGG